MEFDFRDNESVVSPSFCTAHGRRDSYILLVPLPDDYIVNKISVFGSWVHLRCPVAGREVEDSVGDQEVMLRAGL